MKHLTKQLLGYLLIAAMLLSLLPFAVSAEENGDKSASDALWAQITALEDKTVVAKRGTRATAADYAALSGEVAALVTSSVYYEEGTCTYDGENAFFFWETTDGEVCGYSPRLRSRIRTADGAAAEGDIETASYAKKGGSPDSVDVAVFQPYYGIDSSFTTRYKNEGASIAEATGGTSTTYLTTKATIDAIADAMETCGVVIFDSHGTTDYENNMGYTDRYGDYVYDYTSKANSSYICLQSKTGITNADMAAVTGTYGTYYHYFNGGSYGKMYYYCVDGTAIANHMENDAPHNLLWMAICLGMATEGLQAPLREKGVEVVYGYSQSVTFTYDYKWEETFFDKLCGDSTVAEAVAAMKKADGSWDDNTTYKTVADAQKYFAAFPIVASSEDPYPGQGKVDNLQTVCSTWTLKQEAPAYTLTAASNDKTLGTVSATDIVVTATPAEGAYVAGYTLTPANAATVVQEGNVFRVTDMTADCLLTVNFAARTPATVHYSVPDGCTKADSTGYVGESIALSAPEGKPSADAYSYSFVGWTEMPVSETKTQPKNYSSSYTPMQAETTLYALYQYYNGEMVKCYTTELKNSVQYSLTAAANDESLGAVSVTGNVVTAEPSEGAYVAGYTLTPEGAATVTQEGNTFRVENLTADCHLTVRFAAKAPAKITYSVPEGCEKAEDSGYVGDALKLTPPTGTPKADAESYTFVGWTLDKLEDSAAAPAYFTDTFTPTAEKTTLYALYTYEKDGAPYYTTVLRSRECYLLRYTDTDVDAWYHEALDFAVGSGYMGGVAADRFDPEGTLTRAMLATILYRMSGETGGSHPFTDVPANEWYADAVAWAYTAGVVNGTGPTLFSPQEPVTREQTAAMLYRYAAHMGEDTKPQGNLSAFRDAEEISEYAKIPLRWAVGLHILNGKENSTLDPTGTATRAEIAQILLNLSKVIPS